MKCSANKVPVFIRVFGSNECPTCLGLKDTLTKENIKFEFIDALSDDDDAVQDFCDAHDVEHLPHVQIVEGDTIVYQAIEKVDVSLLIAIYKSHDKHS